MSERKTQQETAAKAEEIWRNLNDNERFGIRFGMFPAGVMKAAEAEGYTKGLAGALMDVATKNGGMRA